MLFLVLVVTLVLLAPVLLAPVLLDLVLLAPVLLVQRAQRPQLIKVMVAICLARPIVRNPTRLVTSTLASDLDNSPCKLRLRPISIC